jgi:ABC-type lipoprotein release transport system permease subunit
MSALVRIAWRNLGRNPRRTGLTAAAVVFASSLALLNLALAAGSHERWIDHAVRLYPGHVQLSLAGYREERTLDYATPLSADDVRRLDALPGSVGWAPRLESWALAIPDREEAVGRAVMLVGVDPARETELSRLGSSLRDGRFLGAGEELEVVLGEGLARHLEVRPGDRVILLSSDYYGSQAAERFRVVGTLGVGDRRFDDAIAVGRLDQLQRLLELEGGVSHVALFAARSDRAGALRDAVAAAFEPARWEAAAWPELIPDIVQLALLDDVGNYLSLGILIAVAGFGILNTILMSVLERVREFGVMRAIGLAPRAIFGLVLLESLLLSALGIGIGVAITLPLIALLEGHPIYWSAMEESAALFNIEPLIVFLLKGSHFLAMAAVVFAVALAAAIAPALRASRGRPVDALREM